MLQTPLHRDAAVRILVVDDERFVRTLIGRWLSDEAFDVVLASDVAEANTILRSASFDIITSDINMPGVSGIDWLPQLFSEHPHTAVLMLTGCGDIQRAIQALTEGACGYLLKPVDRQELIFQVRRALERQRMMRLRQQYTETLERQVREQTQQLRDSHEETIGRLISATQLRDEETGEHIRRIGIISGILATALGWCEADVDSIRMAAPMHDIGKVGIPDAILRKPARLDRQEYELMKQHTVIGAEILSGSQLPMMRMAEQIARAHHERWDGDGYPNGLAAEQIPAAARIVSVADVYDALSHDRVYRPAMSQEQVLAIIGQGRGTQFDPAVVDCFFHQLDKIAQTLAAPTTHRTRRTVSAAGGHLPGILAASGTGC